VLYGDLASSNFRALHSYLLGLASSPERRVSYIFRPAPPAQRDETDRSYLSGYGISLDLKKMEYLAVDDRRGSSSTTTEKKDTEEDAAVSDLIVELLNKYPTNERFDASAPLTEDELTRMYSPERCCFVSNIHAEIGSQATQLIVAAADPLEALRTLSQNFPKYATTIARRVVVDEPVKQEVYQNSLKAQPGVGAVWLNGAMLNEGDMNPFACERLLNLIDQSY
jgi:UDP-glucose:glycoprotein glucosyltransferase